MPSAFERPVWLCAKELQDDVVEGDHRRPLLDVEGELLAVLVRQELVHEGLGVEELHVELLEQGHTAQVTNVRAQLHNT